MRKNIYSLVIIKSEEEVSRFYKRDRLARQLVGCHPMHQEVTSSIPSQSTCSGCGLNPQ